jgi:putative glutamine amidotransferase
MNRKPVIAVTGSDGGGRWMWWFNSFSLWLAGAKALRMTPERDVDLDRVDALLVGGGDDIDAELYGGEIRPSIRIDRARDAMELKAIEAAEKRSLPILGVCRGAQILNVAYGGSLHVDIYEAYGDIPRLRTPLPRKWVNIHEKTRLCQVLDCLRCRVNAIHHQAVDRLGNGLRVAAVDDHGVVQGLEHGEAEFVLGVQWHPEFLFLHRPQRRLYRRLVAAASAHAAERETPGGA